MLDFYNWLILDPNYMMIGKGNTAEVSISS
jgi:hypothetical protein